MKHIRISMLERAIDDCKKYLHRFKYECVFVVKTNHATHGTTTYLTITKDCKKQSEEINETNDLGNQNDELE